MDRFSLSPKQVRQHPALRQRKPQSLTPLDEGINPGSVPNSPLAHP
jgi:hypothetical protein